MKLAQLASKPQLVKIVIKDEALEKEYGEELEFWMYDRQDMNTFMKLAQLNENDVSSIANVVSDMVLDEDGNKIISDDISLPTNVMLKVVEAAVNSLGNAMNQNTQS